MKHSIRIFLVFFFICFSTFAKALEVIQLNYQSISYNEQGAPFKDEAYWSVMSDDGSFACVDVTTYPEDIEEDGVSQAYCGKTAEKKMTKLCPSGLCDVRYNGVISRNNQFLTYGLVKDQNGGDFKHYIVWKELSTGKKQYFETQQPFQRPSLSADGKRMFLADSKISAVYAFEQEAPLWSKEVFARGRISSSGNELIFETGIGETNYGKREVTWTHVDLTTFKESVVLQILSDDVFTMKGASHDLNRLLISTTSPLSDKDRNEKSDLYVYDRQKQQATLVTFDAKGFANGAGTEAKLNPSGTKVFFTSWEASHLMGSCRAAKALFEVDRNKILIIKDQNNYYCGHNTQNLQFGDTGVLMGFYGDKGVHAYFAKIK